MKTWLFILAVAAFIPGAKAQDADIRAWAPAKPKTRTHPIALPQSGSTLDEVGGDWARRQIHLSTNGADEQFLVDTNETLDRFFGVNDGVNNGATPAVTEDALAGGRAPASAETQEKSWMKPRSLHMSKIGEFELAFGSNTKLHCDLVNGNELTLSKPIFQDIDLRLHHENTLNSIQLKFNW
jgi:hypothetical protein